MRGSEFDEVAFFASIAKSGARALLIGRRALVALGMPVLTADYDSYVRRSYSRWARSHRPPREP